MIKVYVNKMLKTISQCLLVLPSIWYFTKVVLGIQERIGKGALGLEIWHIFETKAVVCEFI